MQHDSKVRDEMLRGLLFRAPNGLVSVRKDAGEERVDGTPASSGLNVFQETHDNS